MVTSSFVAYADTRKRKTNSSFAPIVATQYDDVETGKRFNYRYMTMHDVKNIVDDQNSAHCEGWIRIREYSIHDGSEQMFDVEDIPDDFHRYALIRGPFIFLFSSSDAENETAVEEEHEYTRVLGLIPLSGCEVSPDNDSNASHTGSFRWIIAVKDGPVIQCASASEKDRQLWLQACMSRAVIPVHIYPAQRTAAGGGGRAIITADFPSPISSRASLDLLVTSVELKSSETAGAAFGMYSVLSRVLFTFSLNSARLEYLIERHSHCLLLGTTGEEHVDGEVEDHSSAITLSHLFRHMLWILDEDMCSAAPSHSKDTAPFLEGHLAEKMLTRLYNVYSCDATGFMGVKEFVSFMHDLALEKTHIAQDTYTDPIESYHHPLNPLRLLASVPTSLGHCRTSVGISASLEVESQDMTLNFTQFYHLLVHVSGIIYPSLCKEDNIAEAFNKLIKEALCPLYVWIVSTQTTKRNALLLLQKTTRGLSSGGKVASDAVLSDERIPLLLVLYARNLWSLFLQYSIPNLQLPSSSNLAEDFPPQSHSFLSSSAKGKGEGNATVKVWRGELMQAPKDEWGQWWGEMDTFPRAAQLMELQLVKLRDAERNHQFATTVTAAVDSLQSTTAERRGNSDKKYEALQQPATEVVEGISVSPSKNRKTMPITSGADLKLVSESSFLRLCQDFAITPQLISRAQCSAIFRSRERAVACLDSHEGHNKAPNLDIERKLRSRSRSNLSVKTPNKPSLKTMTKTRSVTVSSSVRSSTPTPTPNTVLNKGSPSASVLSAHASVFSSSAFKSVSSSSSCTPSAAVRTPSDRRTSKRDVGVGYADFVEAIAITAVVGLSAPQYTALFPSAFTKVLALLNLWGVADLKKLAEIQSINRSCV